MSLPHSPKPSFSRLCVKMYNTMPLFYRVHASLSNCTLNCVSVQILTATSVFCIQLRSRRLLFVPKFFCPFLSSRCNSYLFSSVLLTSLSPRSLQRASKDFKGPNMSCLRPFCPHAQNIRFNPLPFLHTCSAYTFMRLFDPPQSIKSSLI